LRKPPEGCPARSPSPLFLSGMPDHPHTIDRWDDATGENPVEQIAAVGDFLVALETYRAAVTQEGCLRTG
jgi:hypothetical protein